MSAYTHKFKFVDFKIYFPLIYYLQSWNWYASVCEPDSHLIGFYSWDFSWIGRCSITILPALPTLFFSLTLYNATCVTQGRLCLIVYNLVLRLKILRHLLSAFSRHCILSSGTQRLALPCYQSEEIKKYINKQ